MSLKKIRAVTNFFKGKKIINILKFIYNIFLSSQGGPVTTLASMWSYPNAFIIIVVLYETICFSIRHYYDFFKELYYDLKGI